MGRAASVLLVGLGLSCTHCGSGATGMPPSAASVLSGKPLPNVERRTLSGERIDLAKLQGRVVVVKFFADYCAPCKKTLPAAEALHRARPDVAFVGISEDESPSTAGEIARRFSLSFPIVHDAGQVLAGRFRVSEMPATFVAGPDGTIRWVGGAAQAEDDLERAIEAAAR